MNFILRVTDEAEEDLRLIEDYIGSNNPIRAESYIREILNECDKIISSPYLFPIIPNLKNHQIRKWNYDKYLIFYTIKQNQVVIVRIIHGARDYLIFFEN